MRGDGVAFASHWQLRNYRVLTESGPLWVVLGDSTAQGLGAPSPESGSTGQVLAELQQRTGRGGPPAGGRESVRAGRRRR